MARCHLALCCRPQLIARFLALFPKLAVLFLVIHVSAIIYSAFKTSPQRENYHAVGLPPGAKNMAAHRDGSLIIRAIQSANLTDGKLLSTTNNKTKPEYGFNKTFIAERKKMANVKVHI